MALWVSGVGIVSVYFAMGATRRSISAVFWWDLICTSAWSFAFSHSEALL
jgi:hypothetical protein